ncbi:septum formation inhibitor Maf [Bacillaceae bacterium SIJ1]|uniref:Maf family protein n=1 Tax=Litoribacterium kuwaitense TaxID=1398745 RepID=UPI0013ED82C2|nr:Maf family protein [Litoribacterium kuwaitense]NGP45490.1 septum formation inhibitor Maf [Litoribacterium kuwaitense]
MNSLVLASGSPRRLQLLESFGYHCTVVPSQINEKFAQAASPQENAKRLAYEKAQNVYQSLHTSRIVLAADTVVSSDDELLAKPQNKDEAASFLKCLSGKVHHVSTGVAIVNGAVDEVFVETTEVHFWPLSEAEITAYIATNEPYDKAGGYGIQGTGALFVKQIYGDYYNVVGLPIARTYRKLQRFGCHPLVK